MMNRLKNFENLKTHPWLSRIYNKLSTSEIDFAVNFIKTNDALSKSEFEFKVNRVFINKEKPKRWKEISELLVCSNQ